MSASRRSNTSEADDVEALQRSLERLRLEVGDLRASRERLVLIADADRRDIERDLHDGPQQHLTALAANLQLARQLADTDATAAKTLLDEMGHDVRHALDEMGKLAHRIYPPLLEAGGLAAALRAAAVSVGVRCRIEVAADRSYPPEVAGAVYFCCLEVLENAHEGANATISVRDDDGSLVFDVSHDGAGFEAASDGVLGPLRERVEALDGQLTIASDSGDGTRISGSLPLSRRR